MLNRDELLSLARTRRLKPWQEEKRYVQALVLYSLSEAPLVAKGGTYLWFFHGLNRFSDDLDFTAEKELTRKVSLDVRKTLELFGVQNTLRVTKDDKLTLSLKVAARGPLYQSEKDTCYVNIEVSRREGIGRKPISVELDEAFYGIPIVHVKGMDLEEVASEKIRALLTRENARDLYDLWYLITKRNIRPDRNFVDSKLSFYGKTLDDKELQTRIDSIAESWYQELRPIVLGEVPSFEEVKKMSSVISNL
jgi:predicted nucleotidyltransferase component of viral defense system